MSIINSSLYFIVNNTVHVFDVQHENCVEYTYRDLMCSFEKVLGALVQTNQWFPTTIGINAFRGFVDEFSKKKENKELPEIKEKHKALPKKKKSDVLYVSVLFLCSFSISTFICSKQS